MLLQVNMTHVIKYKEVKVKWWNSVIDHAFDDVFKHNALSNEEKNQIFDDVVYPALFKMATIVVAKNNQYTRYGYTLTEICYDLVTDTYLQSVKSPQDGILNRYTWLYVIMTRRLNRIYRTHYNYTKKLDYFDEPNDEGDEDCSLYSRFIPENEEMRDDTFNTKMLIYRALFDEVYNYFVDKNIKCQKNILDLKHIKRILDGKIEVPIVYNPQGGYQYRFSRYDKKYAKRNQCVPTVSNCRTLILRYLKETQGIKVIEDGKYNASVDDIKRGIKMYFNQKVYWF